MGAGNSGILLNETRGEEIDAMDAVLRFNNAPVSRFEKYAGSQTTFRQLNIQWSKSYTTSRAAAKKFPTDNIFSLFFGDWVS